MEQYNENQYDDDLTDGSAEYDDSYYTGAEDLFDYTPDEESPISRLKSLVLSIDWEITDEVLMEFNEELVDLKDIWAGEKINLVYVQALEKLSKYIYQKKAESHPSAIKLLLTLYHNLEKIVSSEDLSDAEKKAILLEDVKRFEDLKTHLKTSDSDKSKLKPKQVVEEPVVQPKTDDGDSVLLHLKAIVLGIDWEITDEDLSALRKEVIRLESLFAGNRPRLILLQGIGTIGAYIKVKKSDSHADAFKVLHLFYDNLEKLVSAPMSLEEEKAILFPAVEKFNAFKALLGETISPASISRSEKDNRENNSIVASETVVPAFSDFTEDEVMGFQADQEAAALGIDDPDNVNSHVADFFGEDSFIDERQAAEEVDEKLDSKFAESSSSDVEFVDKTVALEGVDVEEGEEDKVGISSQGEITPALSFEEDIDETLPVAQSFAVPDVASNITDLEHNFIDERQAAVEVDEKLDNKFAESSSNDVEFVDKTVALDGVDVEEGEEDKEAIPSQGEITPALSFEEDIDDTLPVAQSFAVPDVASNITDLEHKENVTESIEVTFPDDEEDEIVADFSGIDKNVALQGVDVESEADDDSDEDALPLLEGELAPALADNDEVSVYNADTLAELANPDILDGEVADTVLDFFEEESEIADHVEVFEESASQESFELDEDFVPSTEKEPTESLIADIEANLNGKPPVAFEEVDFESSAHPKTSDEEVDNEDLSSDIESQLDDFFGNDELDDSDPASEVFSSFGLQDTADDSVDDIKANTIEEEVVFELVEDPIVSTNLAEGMVAGDVPSITTAVNEKSDTSDLTISLDRLAICIDAAGVELEDNVLNGLLDEIKYLEKRFDDKPLEGIFLHLLKTLSKHIDRYRYEAGSRAYDLLKSVFEALVLSQSAIDQKQDLILAQTVRVLDWQQEIIDGDGNKTSDRSVNSEPMFVQELGNSEDQMLNFEDDLLGTVEDDLADEIATPGNLKDEISSLRKSLQDEISVLKKSQTED